MQVARVGTPKKSVKRDIIDRGVDHFMEAQIQLMEQEGEDLDKINYPSSILAMIYLSLIKHAFIADLENYEEGIVESVFHDITQIKRLMDDFILEVKRVEGL